MPARKNKQISDGEEPDSNVTFYRSWCKRCGICVAFCPTEVLELDEWGYPFVALPEKCTMCHLCEKLCPDFAIGVGESAMDHLPAERAQPDRKERPAVSHHTHSPERVAPPPSEEEEDDAEK